MGRLYCRIVCCLVDIWVRKGDLDFAGRVLIGFIISIAGDGQQGYVDGFNIVGNG